MTRALIILGVVLLAVFIVSVAILAHALMGMEDDTWG